MQAYVQLVTEHYQHQNQQLCNVKFVNGETILRLKDKKGHFKNEAIVCVMQLIGENKVLPVCWGAVIKTIAKQLLNTHVPHADLPSSHSAIWFADRGHVISKLHVTETLFGTDHYDLHSDGTSRCGKKYLSQQMTAPGATMCTGFTTLCTEDTTTLLDATVCFLCALSDLYAAAKAEE